MCVIMNYYLLLYYMGLRKSHKRKLNKSKKAKQNRRKKTRRTNSKRYKIKGRNSPALKKSPSHAKDIRKSITADSKPSEIIAAAKLDGPDDKKFRDAGMNIITLIGKYLSFLGEDKVKEDANRDFLGFLTKIGFDNEEKRNKILNFVIDRVELMIGKIPEDY